MEAIECLKTRRSVRTYKPDPVERKIIEDIIDCGRLAATGMNTQPWEFIAVLDPSLRRTIADITEHGKFIADAPCCIAVVCEKVKYYIEDGSAATQNILVAARAHGLASCWVAADKKLYCGHIANILGVPETHTLMSLIAIGYSDAVPTPNKRSLREVIHWDVF